MRKRNGIVKFAAMAAIVAIASGAFAKDPAPAPRFKVKDVTGRTLDLAELRTHGPVLLDFWATWCKPCVESLGDLEALHEKYGPDGLTIVGVSVDGPRNYARVRPFAASKGLKYPIVIDQDGKLQQLYQVLAVPTAFLIDTSGAIVKVRVAYRPGEGAKFEESIKALLPARSEP